jgi:hypothetical protein
VANVLGGKFFVVCGEFRFFIFIFYGGADGRFVLMDRKECRVDVRYVPPYETWN